MAENDNLDWYDPLKEEVVADKVNKDKLTERPYDLYDAADTVGRYAVEAGSNVPRSAFNLVKGAFYDPLALGAKAAGTALQTIPEAGEFNKSFNNLKIKQLELKKLYEQKQDPMLLSVIQKNDEVLSSMSQVPHDQAKALITDLPTVGMDLAKQVWNIPKGITNRYVDSMELQKQMEASGDTYIPFVSPILNTIKTDPVGVAADIYSLKGSKKTPTVTPEANVAAKAIRDSNGLKTLPGESLAKIVDPKMVETFQNLKIPLNEVPTRLLVKDTKAGGKSVTNSAVDIERINNIKSAVDREIKKFTNADDIYKELFKNSTIKGKLDTKLLSENLKQLIIEDSRILPDLANNFKDMGAIFDSVERLDKPGSVATKVGTNLAPASITGLLLFLANGLPTGIGAGLTVIAGSKIKNLLNNSNNTRFAMAQSKYLAKQGLKTLAQSPSNMGPKFIAYQQALKNISNVNESAQFDDEGLAAHLNDLKVVNDFKKSEKMKPYEEIGSKAEKALGQHEQSLDWYDPLKD